MYSTKTFEQFLTTQSSEILFVEFAVNFLLAALLAYLLGHIYVKFGRSLSNRKQFADTFVLLTTTTMMIIVIVKSSLALSLGLVGALSIVRFRSAIKEPEELTYLFLCIGLGLALGADQRIVAIFSFVLTCFIILLRYKTRSKENGHNLYLTVSSSTPDDIRLEDLVNIINKHCTSANLKRFDESADLIETLFIVEFKNFDALNAAKKELQMLSDTASITFMDSERAY